jgi:hypothetical protein
MQPTNRLLRVQFRAGIRLVTNAVSHETLLISDFLSHRPLRRMRNKRTPYYTYTSLLLICI